MDKEEKISNKHKECSRLRLSIERLEEEISNAEMILKKYRNEYKVKLSHIDPHVTVNHQKYSSGVRYMGRFRLYLNEEDKPKLVTISIGNIKDFKGDDDPQILVVAREKAINYILNKHPELFS